MELLTEKFSKGMQATMPARVLSRVPALGFRPRIVLRSEPGHDLKKYGPGVVIRYGVMPDGSEVSLGRTVDRNLGQARAQYWGRLYLAGLYGWMPRKLRGFAFRVFDRWWPVKVEGYEMTPLPALKG